jgi:hypothetical protein
LLRGIFRPKRDGLSGERRKLHSEKLHDLYFSPNIFSGNEIKNAMSRACCTYGEEERRVQCIGEKTLGEKTTAKPRQR